MLLKRFYDDRLAQASYLLGCEASGEALVVDPNRDADQYLAAARAEGLRVTHVTETHIHADFVSGARELAQRAGAELLLSGEGGPDWSYAFAAADGARLLRDGDSFRVGNVRVDVMHTPGHTPEHLTFVVTERSAAVPMGAFTGDFVFVGDVGRPDLLERAAKVENSMETSARALFRSLRRFHDLPDHLQIWPGHGAGSACGKSLGAVPQSTLGYEKLVGWAFAVASEDEFVRAVLAGQPEPPRYFAEMKRVNRDGPPILDSRATPARLPSDALPSAVEDEGALVVDVRPAAEFAAGHVPGTVGIPLNKSFTTWAGSLLPYDRDLYLIATDAEGSADSAARALAMIGLDRVRGYFGAEAVDAWRRAAGEELERVPHLTTTELRARLANGSAPVVVDVRGRGEWDAGHIPGATHIPLGELGERAAEIPRDRPVVLHCQGGGRSVIAAGLLQRMGISNVENLTGGFGEWRSSGGPVDER